jgi:hypothetical protein
MSKGERMSKNKPKKKIYLYTKTSANWSRHAGPADPSFLQGYISTGKKYKQTVAKSSMTGVGSARKQNRTGFWAVIEVDSDIEPAESMTDQELSQYNILASG